MRKHIIFISLSVVFLSGCGATTYYTRGQAVDADNGRPIPSVKVLVISPSRDGRSVVIKETTGTPDGIYEVRHKHVFGSTIEHYLLQKSGYHPMQLSIEDANAIEGGSFVGNMNTRILHTVRLRQDQAK